MLLRISDDYDGIQAAQEGLDVMAERHGFSSEVTSKLKVILDELLNNIMSYAYDDTRDHEIMVNFEVDGTELRLTISDGGKPFNPLAEEDRAGTLPVAQWETNGLGIHLARSFADHAAYERQDNRNVVTLIKQFEPRA